MKTIYNICEICHHLRLYKNHFGKSFYSSLTCIVHGIILSTGIVGLKKIAASCINGKSQQALSYFFNSIKDIFFKRLHNIRLNIQLAFANKLKKEDLSFFIIDDYLFKKRKIKRPKELDTIIATMPKNPENHSAWFRVLV